MNEILLTDVLDGYKNLENESFDIILIDPPYLAKKDFGNDSDKMPLDDYKGWAKKWIYESLRCLKESGTMYIYGFDEILAHISVMLPTDNQRWITWFYTNKTTPRCNFWNRSHESIICVWKDKNKRIFNVDAVRGEYTSTFLKHAAGRVRKNTKSRFGETTTVYTAHPGGSLPRDVIEVSALAGGAGFSERWFLCKDCNDAFSNKELDNHSNHQIVQHPTQKPYKLTLKLLEAARPKEGGKLLVPFVGSGSEVAVAQDLKMEYLGFEINQDYVNLANLFLKKR